MGVIFDVETATNEIGRLFFWHRGGLLENSYRTQERAMAIGELKSYLQHNFARDDWFYTSNNERFRRICTMFTWAGWIWRNSPGCSSAPFPSA
mgnify:CR=1 FL=1